MHMEMLSEKYQFYSGLKVLIHCPYRNKKQIHHNENNCGAYEHRLAAFLAHHWLDATSFVQQIGSWG